MTAGAARGKGNQRHIPAGRGLPKQAHGRTEVAAVAAQIKEDQGRVLLMDDTNAGFAIGSGRHPIPGTYEDARKSGAKFRFLHDDCHERTQVGPPGSVAQ